MSRALDAKQYQAILESLPNGIYVVDTSRRIIFWNDGAERITGYLRQEVIGCCCRDDLLMHCDEFFNILCGTRCPLLATMSDGRPRDTSVLLRHKDGRRVPVRVRAIPVRDDNGAIIGAVETFDEHPPSPEAWPHPHVEAVHNSIDRATGVSDRAAIASYVQACLSDFADDRVPFSVLSVAVMGLPELRKSHSPEAAQKLLHAVAATLAGNLPKNDVVGHWGEDRFVAILRDCPACALERAAAVLERVVRGIAIPWWGDRLSVAIAAGGAAAHGGDTVEALLARSERALSRARNGEQPVVIA